MARAAPRRSTEERQDGSLQHGIHPGGVRGRRAEEEAAQGQEGCKKFAHCCALTHWVETTAISKVKATSRGCPARTRRVLPERGINPLKCSGRCAAPPAAAIGARERAAQPGVHRRTPGRNGARSTQSGSTSHAGSPSSQAKRQHIRCRRPARSTFFPRGYPYIYQPGKGRSACRKGRLGSDSRRHFTEFIQRVLPRSGRPLM